MPTSFARHLKPNILCDCEIFYQPDLTAEDSRNLGSVAGKVSLIWGVIRVHKIVLKTRQIFTTNNELNCVKDILLIFKVDVS